MDRDEVRAQLIIKQCFGVFEDNSDIESSRPEDLPYFLLSEGGAGRTFFLECV